MTVAASRRTSCPTGAEGHRNRSPLGERLTTDDFAKAIGKGDDPRGTWSVAGLLGALQKRCRRTYGRDWPFECTLDQASETYYYSMAPEYASVISAAAAGMHAAIDEALKKSAGEERS